ncbi:small heat shock protein [Suillus paluster]|uniref:small heat shock protein n=1 Tax=Suillus paluster TaxID=48578 RepID=UPI001B875F72|nr:small heat shock protein [Suillus paluster]KAG1750643.1 small heat shock protein [Suillus paluster]
MALTRSLYDPFTEFDRLFDDAFTSRFRPSTALTESSLTDKSRLTKFRPKMDLIETKDNQIMARFELPGMKPGQVNVDVHNDHLTISGESQQSTETKDGQFVVREGSYGRFARTLQLPEGTQVRSPIPRIIQNM